MNRVISAVVIAFLTGSFGFITYLVIVSFNHTDDFNEWLHKCSAAGGQASVTETSFWKGDYYDCFVGREKVILK